MNQTRQLSHRDLYELVWARPVTKIATDFGISDVALHKICKKHRVPVPGRGYRATLAPDKPVKQTVFRQIQDPHLDRIQIQRSAARSMPPAVRRASVGRYART
jgi:hypothetical protein